MRKMKKASSNLIMTGNARSSNRNSIHGGVAVPGSGQSSSGGSHRAGGGRASVPNSVSAGANLGSLDIESAGGVGIHGHHPDSCSSVGNDSNDSLGSGQHSPSPDMLVTLLILTFDVSNIRQHKWTSSFSPDSRGSGVLRCCKFNSMIIVCPILKGSLR